VIWVEKANFPISLMCRVLEVSRSGYYAWEHRSISERDQQDAKMLEKIRVIYQRSRGLYGSPRIHAELKKQGYDVSRKRVARLMAQDGIQARRKKPYRRTTDSDHDLVVAPNLLERRFDMDGPNQAWVGDITYVWTLRGFMYLAVVIDLYSRRVVGWAMDDNMRTELVLKALRMALWLRNPPHGCIHHSDRGSQYASNDYQEVLCLFGLLCSMSRKGDCWDNAVAESFFGTLENELLDLTDFATHEEARIAIHEYIEVFYNRKRSHSYLGYVSPVDFERLAIREAAEAA